MNGHTLLSVILEHCPPWIIEESRKIWIKDAIETRNLTYLQLLTRTVEPFIIDATEYLECAARIENNRSVIEYLLSLNCFVYELNVLKSAVKIKSLPNLGYFHQQAAFPIDDHLFSIAAETEDNIPIMEYLMSHNCPIIHLITSIFAAKNGALNNLEWLLKKGFSMEDKQIFRAAIKSGSLKVLKWLKENKCTIGGGCYLSLEKCSIETIEWLLEQGITIEHPSAVFRGAARNGRLDKMEWLLKKNYSIEDPSIFAAAAEHGSLENLECLLKNGCSIDKSYIFTGAAGKGHFEVMKWLLKNKCPIDYSVILAEAARFGSIEQMQWLLDNKCPIDNNPTIFDNAAETGNVELMEWLVTKGCPTDRAMHGAVKNGCLTIMKWLLKKGCSIDDCQIMVFAAQYGSLRNMKWLLRHGCPIDDIMIFEAAAGHGSLRNMKWLLDNKCPINHPKIMKSAIKHGSLINMKWLWKNGCSIEDSTIFDCAVYYGSRLRTLKWLLENKCRVHTDGKGLAIETFSSFEKLLQLLEVDPSIVVYVLAIS